MNPLWKLVVDAGPDKGKEFTISQTKSLIIGRGSDSDTQIRDPKMSRIHCEVRLDPFGLIVQHRGGASGTILDGEPVDTMRTLRSGSVLQIGDSLLRVEQGHSIRDAATLRLTPDAIQDAKPKTGNLSSLVGQNMYYYKLEKVVATGRNSAIFKGTDQKRNSPVAVKVLSLQMTDSDDQRERFIRAMKTILPVRSDHIVRLYNAGKQNGHCWAAMEWIQGTSAAKLIDRAGIGGTLEWRQVFRCGVHIARALVAASKHQIVHRNITPANILKRDENEQYLLSDLVFAKALESTNASQLTKPGDILGELGYLAPERVIDATKLDVRSDFFGLGATLYALLTGHPPYRADSVAQWMQAIAGDSPSPPIRSQIGMDERFSDLVMRLIAKSPQDRYDSASQILEDFRRVGTFAGIDTHDC